MIWTAALEQEVLRRYNDMKTVKKPRLIFKDLGLETKGNFAKLMYCFDKTTKGFVYIALKSSTVGASSLALRQRT